MPFLTPAIPALIGMGGSIGASLLGKKIAGSGSPSIDPNSPQGKLLALQQKGIEQGQATAGELTPIAKNFLTTAQQGFQQPTDFWSRILSGSRQAATSLLSPQIQQIQESGQKAGEAAQWLSPRSGTTAAGREMSIYAPTRATSTLLQTLRPQAANNLVDIASREGSLGTGTYGAASSFLNSANTGASNALDYLRRLNQQQFDQSRATGSGLFDLIKNPLNQFGGWLQGKIGGRGSVPGNPADTTGVV